MQADHKFSYVGPLTKMRTICLKHLMDTTVNSFICLTAANEQLIPFTNCPFLSRMMQRRKKYYKIAYFTKAFLEKFWFFPRFASIQNNV